MGREILYGAGGRGRDGSQGQGRGGQGRGSQDQKPKSQFVSSSKAPEMKFIPHGKGLEVQGKQPLIKPSTTTSFNWCKSHLEMEKT
jgi:hypothetical protein